MIDLSDPPAAPTVHVDWIWSVSVGRVLGGPPDLLGWASCRASWPQHGWAAPSRDRPVQLRSTTTEIRSSIRIQSILTTGFSTASSCQTTRPPSAGLRASSRG